MQVTIRVTMPDGSLWDVPGDAVAWNRAVYYADLEVGEDKRQTAEWAKIHGDEFMYTLTHDDDLLDWAANNMNWSDVAHSARRVEAPPPSPPDMRDGWINGDKRVIRS